jgi:uncharacterized protein affecting Mg2+/Co2+ transport
MVGIFLSGWMVMDDASDRETVRREGVVGGPRWIRPGGTSG